MNCGNCLYRRRHLPNEWLMAAPKRLRYTALLPLWCLFTRAVVKDASLSGWGFSAAMMSACFFMFVSKSQWPWLGKSKDFWWKVGVRAENAAFFAAAMPKSYLLPFLGFLLVFKGMSAHQQYATENTLWKCAPLVLLLHPRTGYFLDIVQVGLLVAARHYQPPHVHNEVEFYREHERRLCLDIFGIFTLSTAGSLYVTRAAVAAGTILLGLLLHITYPRKRSVGFWDAINSEVRYTTVPFRQIN